MAIILPYIAQFGSFHGQNTPTEHDGRAVLFVVAELLVHTHTYTHSLTHSPSLSPSLSLAKAYIGRENDLG